MVSYWTYIAWKWNNIGSGYGLVPYGTKPLPDLMLIYDQWNYPKASYCISLVILSEPIMRSYFQKNDNTATFSTGWWRYFIVHSAITFPTNSCWLHIIPHLMEWQRMLYLCSQMCTWYVLMHILIRLTLIFPRWMIQVSCARVQCHTL